jgi:hypothetical protein
MSGRGAFALDAEGLDGDLRSAIETLDELDAEPFDANNPRGFDGVGEATRGFMRPAASAGRSALMLAPAALELFGTGLTEEGEDWYYETVVEGIGQSAVDYWTPDPNAMGSASRALSGVGMVAGSVPQIFGAPGLFLADSGLSPATDLVRAGVESDTAMGVGAVNMAVNAVGMRLPAAFGNTLPQRLVTGAGSNVVLGVAADAGSAEILEQGGHAGQAERFDPADPFARGLDALMGLAFGIKAHVDGPRLTGSQRDAVLVASNASHLMRETLPGVPRQPGADIRHQRAVQSAIDSFTNGERVDVSGIVRPDDFDLRPELRAATTPSEPAGADYGSILVALESGGDAAARAPTSSATGLHQFTDGTWLNTVDQAKPAWAAGLDRAQLLAARTDPAKSAEMERVLRAENAAALERAGQPASTWNLYAAHHFGGGKGVAFAKAAGDTPMTSILSAGQLKANPYLSGLTKDQAIANWTQRARDAGLSVGDVELAATPRQLAPEVEVLFVETARPEAPQIRADEPRPSLEALRTGEQLFPEPPPAATFPEFKAWVEGRQRATLPEQVERLRAEVPRYEADAAAAAEQARLRPREPDLARVAEEQQAQLDALRARLQEAESGNPPALEPAALRDSYDAWRERRQARAEPSPAEPIDSRPRVAESRLREDPARSREPDDTIGLRSEAPAGGPDSPAVLARGGSQGDQSAGSAGARGGSEGRLQAGDRGAGQEAGRPVEGQSRSGQAEPGSADPAVTAARAAVLEAPDLRVPTGEIDADGTPITVSAAELLEQAVAQVRRAELDARALSVAANCALGVGA